MSKQDKAIQIILDFVEGRISPIELKKLFDDNKISLDSLKPDRWGFNRAFADWMKACLNGKYDKLMGEFFTHNVACDYLKHLDVSFKPTKVYEDAYEAQPHVFLISIQPSWMNLTNGDFIQAEVVDKMPKEVAEKSRAQRVKWCKERIKELFRFDKTYPRWIQEAEWPFFNGKPLVFKYQTKERKDDERVKFIFYNPDTGEETIIEQFY